MRAKDCLCLPGYGRKEGGSENEKCSSCTAGKYKAEVKDGECHDCEAGTYSRSMAQTHCIFCPSYSTSPSGSLSLSHCTCNAGFSGDATCFPCQPGSFKQSNGTGMCETCQAGKFAPSYGASTCLSCETCPAGQLCHESREILCS